MFPGKRKGACLLVCLRLLVLQSSCERKHWLSLMFYSAQPKPCQTVDYPSLCRFGAELCESDISHGADPAVPGVTKADVWNHGNCSLRLQAFRSLPQESPDVLQVIIFSPSPFLLLPPCFVRLCSSRLMQINKPVDEIMNIVNTWGRKGTYT